MLLGLFRPIPQVSCIQSSALIFLLLTPECVTAFQVKELDSRRILNEVVNGPTAVYLSRFSFLMNLSFHSSFVPRHTVRWTRYRDASCTTTVSSTTGNPNPEVATLNECKEIYGENFYQKVTSCVSGGKAQGSMFTDSTCSASVTGSSFEVEVDKCILTENGGSGKLTCDVGSDPAAFVMQNVTDSKEIIQNVTDSIVHAFEKSLLLQKGALLSIPSDYQITSSKLLSNQSGVFVVFERNLLLFSLNNTAPAFLDVNALISHAVSFFRLNARSTQIQNLVSPATLMVRLGPQLHLVYSVERHFFYVFVYDRIVMFIFVSVFCVFFSSSQSLNNIRLFLQ